MPEICRFYGIIIKMFFDDHHPPHFHAIYSDFEALIEINPGRWDLLWNGLLFIKPSLLIFGKKQRI